MQQDPIMPCAIFSISLSTQREHTEIVVSAVDKRASLAVRLIQRLYRAQVVDFVICRTSHNHCDGSTVPTFKQNSLQS